MTIIDDTSRMSPLDVVQLLTICGPEGEHATPPLFSQSQLQPALHDTERTEGAFISKGSNPLNTKTIRMAMQKSMFCVAAYCPATCLADLDNSRSIDAMPRAKALERPAASAYVDWLLQVTGTKRDHRMVGFARAVGDGSLVATLHDVCVHPQMRRRGIGSALLRRLTSLLWRSGVIDVGAVVPCASEGFFEANRFGNDSENSVLMKLYIEGTDFENCLPLDDATATTSRPRAGMR